MSLEPKDCLCLRLDALQQTDPRRGPDAQLNLRRHDGIWLLSIYSAGLSLPFLLAALFTDSIAARVKQIDKAGRWLYKSAGVAIIIRGVVIMTGQLSRFAYWLLGTFPSLATIG